MAKTREELHELLVSVLGSRNVYFQPPESIKMQYPAIVYSRSEIQNLFANDSVYSQNLAYEVTIISPDPDSRIVKDISLLPYCRFNRHYKSDNLNHDSFTIYF